MAGDEASMVSVDEGASAEGAVQAEPPVHESEQPLTPEEISARTLDAAKQAELQRIPPELRPDAAGNPPVITEKLLRQLRNRYFTVKHVVLTNCGHKLDMINFPKRNCENCYFQWFNTHPQLVEVADQFYRTHGKGPLIGMRGKKFFVAFTRYMATIIHFMKEEELAKQNAVQSPVVSGKSAAAQAEGTPELSTETSDNSAPPRA
jgi:hypothetical protein